MDWRRQIVSNKRKTFAILLSFFLLYFLMGWVFVAAMSPHPSGMHVDQLYGSDNQYVMAGFMGVSLLFVLVAMVFGGRLSVMGADAEEVKRGREDYQVLYNIVEELKIASKLRFMPKIYVLDVNYYNAFASGWREQNAVIAVSKPLLGLLTREELQAVVAHELSHIKHQDIRVITLVSVCANLLVMCVDMLLRGVLHGQKGKKRSQKGGGGPLIFIILALRILLPILTAFLVAYVSRKREFLADAGCVAMTRHPKALGDALKKIHKAHMDALEDSKQAYYQTPHENLRSLSYIYPPGACGIFNIRDVNAFFATHPSLKDRLKALGVEK